MLEYMVIDIETYDPNLLKKGPGVYRKDGYILGVGVYAPFLNYKKYLNLAHPDCTPEEKKNNIAELREVFKNPCPKVFVNGLYDLSWLINGEYKFTIAGRYEDVITREGFLDPFAAHYKLDVLSKKYGRAGKREDKIQQICDSNGWKGAPQGHLWKMNATDLKEYMEGDLEEPAAVYEAQQPLLEEQGLTEINDLECRLLPCLVYIQGCGYRVDENRRKEVSDMLHTKYRDALIAFEEKYGWLPDFGKTSDMEKLWIQCGLPLEYTAKGNLMFNAEVLLRAGDLGKEITQIKTIKQVMNNYVDGSMVEYVCPDGKIHATLYPSRKDEGGTVTGRFSCANPNMQQIPAKHEKFGEEIRSILIPEEDCWLAAPDFKQIEYRVLSHFAVGPGSVTLRKTYNEDPKTDYHKFVQDLTGLDRKHAKNMNFGILYGMGLNTMMSKFGMTYDQCKEVNDTYMGKMTFIKPTRAAVEGTLKRRGYVRTLMGRHARVRPEMMADGKLYPILNYLIQGSAADIMKKAMVDCYEKGLFFICTPHMTVHDELCISVPKTKEGMECYEEIRKCMEGAIKLDVPLMTDPDMGPNWGDVSEEHYLEYRKAVGL